ncbi:MAG: hypothetical protein QOF62_728 [Pyrinomonadaceae bacterium]|nr:hypothetical protein [Pyrinomonadaceae bacterium]
MLPPVRKGRGLPHGSRQSRRRGKYRQRIESEMSLEKTPATMLPPVRKGYAFPAASLKLLREAQPREDSLGALPVRQSLTARKTAKPKKKKTIFGESLANASLRWRQRAVDLTTSFAHDWGRWPGVVISLRFALCPLPQLSSARDALLLSFERREIWRPSRYASRYLSVLSSLPYPVAPRPMRC